MLKLLITGSNGFIGKEGWKNAILNFNNKQFSMGSYSRQATPLRERRVPLFFWD